MSEPGSTARRIAPVAARLLGISSVLLVLAGGNLLFAAWLSLARERLFWASFWATSGILFIAYGVACLLAVTKLAPGPAMTLLRPPLTLGAIALVLAGAAWPVQTEIRWRRTGDFEAYGVVIGLVMLAQGITALGWLARSRRKGTA